MSAEPTPRAHPRSTFIATAPARAALVPLEQGLGARAPFVLLTGDAGSGRSMLARESLRRRGDRIAAALLPDPAPPASELTATLLKMFGGGAKPGSPLLVLTERLIETLANVTAGGCVAVALIDDAERLSDEHLLELHRITDIAARRQCPLELLLVGTTALPSRFETPALATVRARVSVRATLARFSPNDTREYLQMRLNAAGVPCTGMFSRKAARDIHQVSVGLVRVIEALAAESLRRAARAGSGTVSPEHVRAADHALRTGRPSDEHDTPPPSQVRAAAVNMAANSRAVPNAPAPRHAPTQPREQRAAHAADTPAPAALNPGTTPAAPSTPARLPSEAAPTPASRNGKHGKHHPRGRPQPNGTPNASRTSTPAPATNATRSATPVPAPAVRTHPAPAAATRVTPPVRPTPTAAATDPGSIGAFPSSDDPRVQEWLARFGGKGVRVGAAHPVTRHRRDLDSSEDFGSDRMADADGVVSPARPIRRAAADGNAPTLPADVTPAVRASTPEAGPAAGATPEPMKSRQPAAAALAATEPASTRESGATPVSVKLERVTAAAAMAPNAKPSHEAAARHQPTAPERQRDARRNPRAASATSVAGATPARSPARSAASSAALVAAVVLTAVVAIAVGQRQALGRLFAQTFAASTAQDQANTAIAAPAPVPESPPAPAPQFAIAVGSYAMRDMASAECEYLSRLVPMRVRVGSAGADARGYRLLLGRFDARHTAELARKRLQDRGLIPDARVIEIAPLAPATNAAPESARTASPVPAPGLTLTPGTTPDPVQRPEPPSRARRHRRR